MGLTAIGVPEEFGGPEATDIERMIAIEEIAKKDGAVATILAVHGMLIQALVKYGTDEQKKRFLSQNRRRRILHSIRPYRARRRFRPGFRKDNGGI